MEDDIRLPGRSLGEGRSRPKIRDETKYLFSANGAILILAWGNAPGLRQKFTSADSAIHLRVFLGDYLIRAFSAGFGANFPGALPQACMNQRPWR